MQSIGIMLHIMSHTFVYAMTHLEHENRIYFYLKKGQEDIDGTKLELVGQNNKNISCDLNRHLRKRYDSYSI